MVLGCDQELACYRDLVPDGLRRDDQTSSLRSFCARCRKPRFDGLNKYQKVGMPFSIDSLAAAIA